MKGSSTSEGYMTMVEGVVMIRVVASGMKCIGSSTSDTVAEYLMISPEISNRNRFLELRLASRAPFDDER